MIPTRHPARQVLWHWGCELSYGRNGYPVSASQRRKEVAQLLEVLVERHPTGIIYVAWDNADTHEDDEVEEVVRANVILE